MKSLIEITAELFNKFSERKYGIKARWIKLSKERQKEWVEDSYLILEDLIKSVEKELKPVSLTKQPNASYERGYFNGTENEKMRLRQILEEMRKDYLDQFKYFINED